MSLHNVAIRFKIAAMALALAGSLVLSDTPLGHAEQTEHRTTTPIKHLVIIFQENVSFDHYFGTYPFAENKDGEPPFLALPGTPTVNGLNGALLSANPNSVKPFRIDRVNQATCDQNHDYQPEQEAMNSGLMNRFVETLSNGPGSDGTLTCSKSDVMGYFDGNTVTALWNYAQRFAMNDNSYGTGFGPSTPGALNLISGQTHGAISGSGDTSEDIIGIDPKTGIGSMVGDPQAAGDICDSRETARMVKGKNIGDLLNAKGITWGFFQGGFKDCNQAHTGADGKSKKDYIPHHQPFQYYTSSTANLNHTRRSSIAAIGHQGDAANHEYDLEDFWDAAEHDNLPEVTFLKAPGYQDGHAGYSGPLSEQTFLVETINRLQSLKKWKGMAITIAYDDSDGWYDHVVPPIINPSNLAPLPNVPSTDASHRIPGDALSGLGHCGGPTPIGAYEGRCGYGPRLPLLVISPFAKRNYVDGTLTDQTSILRFIEDNWELGRIGDQSLDEKAGTLLNMFDFQRPRFGRLLLDPFTGQVIHADEGGDNDDHTRGDR